MIGLLAILVVGLHVSVIGTIVIGLAIAAYLTLNLRSDYLHTSPLFTIVAFLPPLSLGTVTFGLLQTWMERVGFGRKMRIAVTTAFGTYIGVIVFGAPPTLWPLFVLLSCTVSVTREFLPKDMYLLPIALLNAIHYIIRA